MLLAVLSALRIVCLESSGTRTSQRWSSVEARANHDRGPAVVRQGPGRSLVQCTHSSLKSLYSYVVGTESVLQTLCTPEADREMAAELTRTHTVSTHTGPVLRD